MMNLLPAEKRRKLNKKNGFLIWFHNYDLPIFRCHSNYCSQTRWSLFVKTLITKIGSFSFAGQRTQKWWSRQSIFRRLLSGRKLCPNVICNDTVLSRKRKQQIMETTNGETDAVFESDLVNRFIDSFSNNWLFIKTINCEALKWGFSGSKGIRKIITKKYADVLIRPMSFDWLVCWLQNGLRQRRLCGNDRSNWWA